MGPYGFGLETGTLYLTDFDGNEVKFDGVIGAVAESVRYAEDDISIIRLNEPSSITLHCKLSFRNRVRLFGFWRTVKNLFRRKKK